VIGQLTGICEK